MVGATSARISSVRCATTVRNRRPRLPVVITVRDAGASCAFVLMPVCFLLGGGHEHVASTQVAVPPAEPLQVLFLLVEFGCRELLDPDLLVDLLVELGALGEELPPLLLTLGAEGFL